MSIIQQSITNWLSFINEFISKSINDIILLRTSTNPRFFSLPSSQLIKDKSISVLIYFVRRHVRFIVEIWTIKVTLLPNPKSKQLSLIKANKKLLTLHRTIAFCLKMLPLYSVFKSKNFDFSFETEIEVDSQQVIESDNKHELSYKNYSDSIGTVYLIISYINKVELFKKEDTIKQSIIQTQIDYTTKTIKADYGSQKDTIPSPNENRININHVNTQANIRESNQCRVSSQTFSFSNSSGVENEPDNFEGMKRKSLIDCSLTPYSKEGTELFWEKNEVRNVMNRYNRLNNYCNSIERQDKGVEGDNDNILEDINDLFLGDYNRLQGISLSSSSSIEDELELAYVEEDQYMNEAIKISKNPKEVHIDEIALKLALLKEQIERRKVSINTSMLARKLGP